MNSQKGFTPIIIVIIVVLLGMGVGGYVFLSKEKPANPSMLIGLWKTESSFFPNGEYLEIKEKEFCFNWQTDSRGFICSRYAPYVVSGNLVGFGESSQPNTVWKIMGNKLILGSGKESKEYVRVSELQ